MNKRKICYDETCAFWKDNHCLDEADTMFVNKEHVCVNYMKRNDYKQRIQAALTEVKKGKVLSTKQIKDKLFSQKED